MTSRSALPNSRASYSAAISLAFEREIEPRRRRASSLPPNFRLMNTAQRLAMLTYLPTRSLFTRAAKSSGLKSMSSTLAFSLAAM